jgi:hypothetical protein
MKQYDLLLSFGCSFTQGGGLNDPRYHKFLGTGLTSSKELDEYANLNSYPKYLADQLACDFINFGRGAAGNEYIFQRAYEECKKHTNENVLVTVQSSILSRMMLHAADSDDDYIINTHTNQPEHVGNYYKTFIQYFFNKEKEFKKLIRNTDLLQTWLTANKFDFVFIGFEGNLPNEYFCRFPSFNGSLGNFAEKEKLLLEHVPNIPYVDRHLTEKGNEQVAKLIFEYLQDKHD